MMKRIAWHAGTVTQTGPAITEKLPKLSKTVPEITAFALQL